MLIAITLLSLLSVGMLMSMRIGLQAFTKTDARLMENRRVAGAQRILEQQIEGLLPVTAGCAPQGGPGVKFAFFGGTPNTLRLVSGFSLQGGWRGQPQILEMFVIPGEQGRGVRLVVNELPYTGPDERRALLRRHRGRGDSDLCAAAGRARFLRAGRPACRLPLQLPGSRAQPRRAGHLAARVGPPRLAESRPRGNGAARTQPGPPATHYA